MNPIQLYVGCYTDNNPGIFHLSYRPKENVFAILSTNSETSNPSFLVKQGNFLFAANENDHTSMLSSYRVDPSSETLCLHHEIETIGHGCCHVAIGKNTIYGSNYGTGNLFGIAIDKGRFQRIVAQEQHIGAVKSPPRAHSTLFDPKQEYLLCCDLGLDRVYCYVVTTNGELAPHATDPFLQLPTGEGPRHMVFHPDGTFVYVITEYSNQIHSLSFDKGHLGLITTTPLPTAGEAYGADVHLHPHDKFLYASLRGANTILAYGMMEGGALDLLGEYPSGGNWPRNFLISADGGYLFVANQRSDTLTACEINQKTGALTPPLAQIELPTPACVIEG